MAIKLSKKKKEEKYGRTSFKKNFLEKLKNL